MRVKFLENATYRQADKAETVTYLAGEIHDLRSDLAERWIRRQLAVAVEPDKPAAKSKGKVEHMIPEQKQ